MAPVVKTSVLHSYNFNTGVPMSPTVGADRARTLTLRSGDLNGQRPDLASGFTTNPNQTTDRLLAFDKLAFADPGAGVLGNLGRNTVIGRNLSAFAMSSCPRRQR